MNNSLNDLIVGAIRTTVPAIVGTFLMFLAGTGFQIDMATTLAIHSAAVGLAVATYYLIVRIIAQKFPWVEALLGSKKTPEYSKENRE